MASWFSEPHAENTYLWESKRAYFRTSPEFDRSTLGPSNADISLHRQINVVRRNHRQRCWSHTQTHTTQKSMMLTNANSRNLRIQWTRTPHSSTRAWRWHCVVTVASTPAPSCRRSHVYNIIFWNVAIITAVIATSASPSPLTGLIEVVFWGGRSWRRLRRRISPHHYVVLTHAALLRRQRASQTHASAYARLTAKGSNDRSKPEIRAASENADETCSLVRSTIRSIRGRTGPSYYRRGRNAFNLYVMRADTAKTT